MGVAKEIVMRLLVIPPAALLLLSASEPEPIKPARVVDPNASAPADCPPISRYHAMRRGGPLAAQKLNQLPAADHYNAVYRRIGGCEVPMIVSFGVGRR